MNFRNKIIKATALLLCIFTSLSALVSCGSMFGDNNPPVEEQKPPVDSTPKPNPPSSDEGEEEEEEKLSDKGIFFSSNAAAGGDGTIESPYNTLDVISLLNIDPGTHIYIEKNSKFLGSLSLVNSRYRGRACRSNLLWRGRYAYY
jgi:hypothetical protein